MKQLLLVLLTCTTFALFGQTPTESKLDYRPNVFFGTKFRQNDGNVRHKTLRQFFPEGTDARYHYNRHLSLGITSGLASGLGSILICENLFRDEDAESLSSTNKLGIGLGIALVASAIPLEIYSNRSGRRAVAAYNLTLDQPAPEEVPDLDFELGTTGGGIGLTLHFNQ